VAALGTPAGQSSSSLASGAPFGDPLVGFSDFFTSRGDFKNSGFFGTAQKDQKVDNEVPKVNHKSTFGQIRMYLGSHLGIVFSIFFENGESVLSAKSITPNVLPSHQKPLTFASIFHKIFMFFSNPLPETIFGGSKRPSIRKSTFLDRFTIFEGPENDPWNDTFGLKVDFWSHCRRPGALLEPTWARFGAENAPRGNFETQRGPKIH